MSYMITKRTATDETLVGNAATFDKAMSAAWAKAHQLADELNAADPKKAASADSVLGHRHQVRVVTAGFDVEAVFTVNVDHGE